MSANDLYGGPATSAPAKVTSANDLYGKPAPSGGGFNLGVALERTHLPDAVGLLDRFRQASQAGLTGHNPIPAFAFGVDKDQQEANRNQIENAIPDKGFFHSQASVPKPIKDFMTDMVTDPFTYGGPAIMKGAGKLLGMGGRIVGGVASKYAPELSKDIAESAAHVGDFFTPGGSAKRKMGESAYHGAIQAENRQSMKEPEAARILKERYDQIFGQLTPKEKHRVFQMLNGEDQIDDPVSGRLLVPQHIAEAVQEAKKLRNDAGALYANESGRRKLAYGGGRLANESLLQRMEKAQEDRLALNRYPQQPKSELDAFLDTFSEKKPQLPFHHSKSGVLTNPTEDEVLAVKPKARRLLKRTDRAYELPPELQEFAAPNKQGLLGSANVRANYLPGPHAELTPEEAALRAKQRPKPFNLLDPFAPNTLQRESFTTEEKDVPKLEEAFRSMLEQAARQGTAGRLRSEVGVEMGKPIPESLRQLFERIPRAKGEARTLGERMGDRWQGLVNIPKNTVTTIGLKHGLVNVPALAAMSEGVKPAAEGIAGGMKMAGMAPGARYQALKDAIEAGVISNSPERANPIVDFLKSKKALAPLAKVSESTNNMTWAIDDAAKQAVYRAKIERGMNPQDAAAQTLHEMVDYGHRSPFTEKILSKVAPFATFRSKIPGAVASSVVRNPQRLLALDRATQGGGSSGRVGVNDKHATMTTPISDVVGIGDNPFDYGRSTLSDMLKLPLSMPGEVGEMTGKLSPHDASLLRYFTYGHHVLPHLKDGQLRTGQAIDSALNSIPFGAGEGLSQLSGMAEWGPEDWLSVLLGPSLGVHVR